MPHVRAYFRGCLLALLMVITACSAGRNKNQVKPVTFSVASRTSRPHIITETTITLHTFNFTIEYANSHYDHEALKTHWRGGAEAPIAMENEDEGFGIRDRAILHLSPRGKEPGSATTLVASTLEFEMQKIDTKKKKWIYVTPDVIYQSQYAAIVSDLRDRLRRRGYIFN